MSESLDKSISEFINKTNPDLLRENANKDSNLIHSHRDLLAGIVSRDAFRNEIPKDILEAHEAGYIHQHDTDYWISKMQNCSLVNYPEMLENGFYLGNAHISTPNSIGVACTVLTQIALCVGSAQYGK